MLAGAIGAYALLANSPETEQNKQTDTAQSNTEETFGDKYVTYAEANLVPDAQNAYRSLVASSDGNIVIQTVRSQVEYDSDDTTQQYVFISRDGGETWVDLELPIKQGTETADADSINGLDISADGNEIVFSIGEWNKGDTDGGQDSGYVLVSSDAGETWEKKTLPIDSNPYAIYISAGGTKLYVKVVGTDDSYDYGSLLYKSDDFGETWEEVSSTGTDGDNYDYGNIALSADGNKIAIPTSIGAGESGPSVHVSQDAGQTWAVRKSTDWTSSSTGTGIHSVAWSSDGSRLSAVVSTTKETAKSYSARLYTSSDDGDTWTSFALADSTEQGTQSVVGAQIYGDFSNDAATYVGSIGGTVYSASVDSQSFVQYEVDGDYELSDIAIFAKDSRFIGLAEEGYFVGKL